MGASLQPSILLWRFRPLPSENGLVPWNDGLRWWGKVQCADTMDGTDLSEHMVSVLPHRAELPLVGRCDAVSVRAGDQTEAEVLAEVLAIDVHHPLRSRGGTRAVDDAILSAEDVASGQLDHDGVEDVLVVEDEVTYEIRSS